jgi:membrane associated rhomboid family serine protease
MWSASDANVFLQKNAKTLFYPHPLPLWIHIVFGILIALVFLAVGVYLGQKRYLNPKIDDAFDHLDKVISN